VESSTSSSSQLHKVALQITPPIVWRALRSVRSRRNAGRNGSAPAKVKAPLNPDLIEYGADFYDETFENEDRWRKHYWKLIWYGSWAVIGDRVAHAESPRVLDMGCGAGHLAHLLHDHGIENYTGFDFSAKRLEQARVVVPEFRFEVADAYTTDLFTTVDYNIVVCTEFLEHLEGDLRVLARIKSGTRVLGTVPNYDAKAHLRFFDNKQQVEERYGPTFASLNVTQIRNVGGGSEWLIDGVLP
jgi:SAM-dependent methyltransferase